MASLTPWYVCIMASVYDHFVISKPSRLGWIRPALSALLAGAAIFLASPAQAQPSDARFVQVSEAKVRRQPQLWAPAAGDLKYGDSVTILKESGTWVQVRTDSGSEGFLPLAAVTLKKVVLTETDARVKVQADVTDVVLAGKGFSEGLEEALASADVSFNFAAVDEAEKRTVDDDNVLSFIRTGRLAEEF